MEKLKILLIYVIFSYVLWIGLIIFAIYNLKKEKQLKGKWKDDKGNLLMLTVGLAFAPITSIMFLFNIIKGFILENIKK